MARMNGRRIDDEDKLDGIERPFGRLMSYVFRHYPVRISVTIVCIITSAVASAVGSIFMQQIVDNVVTPGLESGFDAVHGTLVRLVVTMGVIFSAGVIGSFIYTRAMAIVTQGTLKHMRDDMFDSMERLPLRFFDTHPHGAIMSTYTNDTDAIRQLIGQSIPTLIQSGLTIVVLVGTMLYYSVWLFLVVLVVGALMAFLTGKLGGLSGRFMKAQQGALADEEGFIEEMMDGQKVVQVFNHEQDAKDEFVEYNDKLFDSSQKANIYGNVLMPALGNIGNIMYVVIAIVGGVMILEQTPNIHVFGVDVITVGVVVSFLGFHPFGLADPDPQPAHRDHRHQGRDQPGPDHHRVAAGEGNGRGDEHHRVDGRRREQESEGGALGKSPAHQGLRHRHRGALAARQHHARDARGGHREQRGFRRDPGQQVLRDEGGDEPRHQHPEHQERQGLDDDTHGERAPGGRAAVQGQERTTDGGHPEKGDDDGDTGER